MCRVSFDATLTKTGENFQDLQEISWANYLRVSSRAIPHIGNAWLGCFFVKPALLGHESRFQCCVGFLTGRLLSHWASCRQCRGHFRHLPILLS